jgi:DNA gyrase subunit B
MPKVTADLLADASRRDPWIAELAERLNKDTAESESYVVGWTEAIDDAPPHLNVCRLSHGLDHPRHVLADFFRSPEYRRISEVGEELRELISEGAFVVRGDAQIPVGSFEVAMEWLMAQSRKGQSFQRYKGLGEMNPNQLWETTINPESRRLMQVRIEDAVSADEIFSTLMGDQVEPRRDFIERNALSASNIDI